MIFSKMTIVSLARNPTRVGHGFKLMGFQNRKQDLINF